MPVPAPATTLLLEGFELFDDGIDGERVTPTAAILHYLCKIMSKPARTHERLLASRTGLGTRVLDGVSATAPACW
jgi:pyridinium-3,5-bisthiocarboxylic acid mononucleotide nickel chelatase